MLRVLAALLVFIAVVFVWIWLVGAVSIWWTMHNTPAAPPGSDTYFFASSRFFRVFVFVPLLIFSVWYWRRVVRRAA